MPMHVRNHGTTRIDGRLPSRSDRHLYNMHGEFGEACFHSMLCLVVITYLIGLFLEHAADIPRVSDLQRIIDPTGKTADRFLQHAEDAFDRRCKPS